jgi:hypothetical protein
MRTALKNVTLPKLAKMGFYSVPFDGFYAGSEAEQLNIGGRLIRENTDSFDIGEIDIWRHQDSKFRLSFGRVDKRGTIDVTGKWVAAQDAEVCGLRENYSFYACPYWMLWFNPKRWYRKKITEPDIYKYINEVTDMLLPEIEAALSDKAIGPHTRAYRSIVPQRFQEGSR